ncbi:hypothetical protein EVG20_g6740 [Dentipellis fragilis]|uniref:Uncharacterized protein n=1 Tax=Dentipellis fragilis TaxID=205917 RepID=A0A4Y9YKL0_9AGAM|nr:hypothetical protein EVG20_g6740 [Dentipellis fragilis]
MLTPSLRAARAVQASTAFFIVIPYWEVTAALDLVLSSQWYVFTFSLTHIAKTEQDCHLPFGNACTLGRLSDRSLEDFLFHPRPVLVNTHVSRANHRQPYSWTGLPNQVSGSSSRAAAPPATAHIQSDATYAGYPNIGNHPPATAYAESHSYDTNYQHGTSFQAPGNPTLHPTYDPHHDEFRATLESAFPHLHTTQIGSATSVTGGSAYQGYISGNVGTDFPHSSYSELANYAGDYCPARNTSEATQATVSSRGYVAPSSMHHNPTSDGRASVAEPSAKGQKRKSRKGATDATAISQAEPLGDEADKERAKKKKKAMQQRGYRKDYTGVVAQLEAVLPDEYKMKTSRLTRRTVDRSVECIQYLRDENGTLKTKLDQKEEELQEMRAERDEALFTLNITRQKLWYALEEGDRRQNTIEQLEQSARYWESDRPKM